MSNDIFQYLLRLGDNALVLSHRLSEWCGQGPALEEDMALANTALDLLGQARMWLTLAGETEGTGRDEDALAYRRSDREFLNFLLVERMNGSYADTTVRQFFFDVWHHLALRRLCESTDENVAAIAAKSLKEVQYHVRRSCDLVVRMGDGTARSRQMMQAAIDDLWLFTGEMFVGDDVDATSVSAGVGFDPAELREPWLRQVRSVLEQATLKMPAAEGWMHRGGKQGRHTEALSFMLGEMQSLQRAHPGAQW